MVVRDETINSLKGYVASYLKSQNIKLLEIPWKENKENEDVPILPDCIVQTCMPF